MRVFCATVMFAVSVTYITDDQHSHRSVLIGNECVLTLYVSLITIIDQFISLTLLVIVFWTIVTSFVM